MSYKSAATADPERELAKVERLAKRMFTQRKFREPVKTERPYQEPSKPYVYRGNVQGCQSCGRPLSYGAGLRCRECYQKQVRAKYEAKVRAEAERVRANEAAFKRVTQPKKGNDMAKKSQAIATPITRSTSGLRSALFEEMEALRAGTSNAQRARSVAMMANSILQSVSVEIEYHKYVSAHKGDTKNITFGTDIALSA